MTKPESPTPRIAVSWGELLDKITILEIKSVRLRTEVGRANVHRELSMLRESSGAIPSQFRDRLRVVNEQLWDAETQIRAHGERQDFGLAFVDLARSIYLHNDERSRIKRTISESMGSELIEEKDYLV